MIEDHQEDDDGSDDDCEDDDEPKKKKWITLNWEAIEELIPEEPEEKEPEELLSLNPFAKIINWFKNLF